MKHFFVGAWNIYLSDDNGTLLYVMPDTKTTPRRRLSQRRPKYRRPNYRRPNYIYHEKFLCTLDKFDIKLAC